MSLTVRSFLNLLKTTPVTSSTIRIVCGNESADLDSVTSAISFAYFKFVENSKDAQPIIPIINIPREDLKLRRDIIHVLNDVNISEDLLFFLEDVKQLQESNKTIEAILVDHNEAVNEAKKYITKVVGVIDHHKDMNQYLDASPRIIKVCGSCTSLVYNYFVNEILPKDYKPGHDVTQLCLAAGLVDTTNFSHRVEQPDLISKELYSKYASDVDMDVYTKVIKNAKNDISGFTARDLLRKDYKQFEFWNDKGIHNGKLTMGISSIVKPMYWLYEEFGGYKELKEDCVRYREEKNVDILTIMTSFVENGKFQRQMTMIPSDEVKSIAKEMVSNITEYLELEKSESDIMSTTSSTNLTDDEEFQQYEQQNVEASRKQVAPSLQKAFHDL
ncbi:similar to Saccharomyces cerevisiae YHR201C PPX1 Exopolyphosphatase, hydrolyzes inorganic polyphosphate (poly P) into Pi residues [Maudiozyma saulgeensis]|uniref:Similar to Saccharomyces cerevisiae YHR201C PPX1 Exopolyphosphatase, hydrolyzes inorganic polyphosphate (Poly P) into Pi residues n=1 Tax=Maudiozyma saulgeensis TaxID=1789683 RepID=A0A1X7R0W4_9SACH|nr:similar to Saccharomyces cerevisiae YHR201C PPX1 Exopolyphosphatase, hydrolyzes inorganic polyphosphate (poly P) into Pi residues [Kazachstania saulgeensis]